MFVIVKLFFAVLIFFVGPIHGLLRGKLFETLPHRHYSQADVGKPLFLTPFLQNDEIEMAKNYSRVRDLPGAEDLESYSGYLTVNEEFNSNLFFWFFPSVSHHLFMLERFHISRTHRKRTNQLLYFSGCKVGLVDHRCLDCSQNLDPL